MLDERVKVRYSNSCIWYPRMLPMFEFKTNERCKSKLITTCTNLDGNGYGGSSRVCVFRRYDASTVQPHDILLARENTRSVGSVFCWGHRCVERCRA